MSALLVVTAVQVEADAILAALGADVPARLGALAGARVQTAAGTVDVLVGGVGVAASCAATSFALAARHYDLVLSAGIAGGFAPCTSGSVVVADAVVQADLGAEDGADFRPLSELGFGSERAEIDPGVSAELARRCSARSGAVLSVSTVTGTAATAADRLHRTPDALAEAMEGAGVLAASRLTGVPFGEVRAISNAVGPRDRSAWDIPLALRALGTALHAVTSAEWTT